MLLLLIFVFMFVFFNVSSFAYKETYFVTLYGDTQYSDNIYLSNTDEEDDVITNLGLIFVADRTSRVSDLKFEYNLGRSFYWQKSSNNAFRHNCSLLYSKELSKKLSFSWVGNYYRTEDVIEPDEEVYRERKKREPYYRISSSFRMSYEYLKDSFVSFGGNINYLQNKDPSVEDSRIYSEYFSFSRSFTKFFVQVKFLFFQREFEQTAPVETYSNFWSFGYRLAHNKHISWDFSADRTQDKDPSGEDYWSYSVGISYVWNPEKDQTYYFRLGSYFRKVDGGDKDKGLTFAVNYLKRYKHSSFSVSGSGGYRYEYAEANNRGFTQYYNISFSYQYQLSRYLDLRSSIFYRIEDFKERQSKETETYGFNISLNKRLTKNVTASLGYSYREADSDFSEDEYCVNTVIATISYTGEIWKGKEFPIRLWPF